MHMFQSYIDAVPDDVIKVITSLEEELEQLNTCTLLLKVNEWWSIAVTILYNASHDMDNNNNAYMTCSSCVCVTS